MSTITAQISLYPLAQKDLRPAIQEVWDALTRRGLPTRAGAMSTLTWGETEQVFEALQEGFQQATKHGSTVMVITVSNACPLPDHEEEPDHA